MHSLPFSATSSIWDEFELDGVLKAGEAGLEIEYEGSWTRYDDDANVSGMTEWKATKLLLAYRDIVSITLDRTWLRTSFVSLRTSSVAAFEGFPLARGVAAEIPVARRYRADASDLVSEVALRVADASLHAEESRPTPIELQDAAPALATGRGPLD